MLSPTQSNRVMYHLGYPLVTMGANAGMYWATLQQMLWPLYAALSHMEPGAETIVVELLTALDATDTQLLSAQTRLKVAAVGDILMNGAEIKRLKEARQEWQARLATLIGVPVNPAAQTGGGCVIRRL